MPGTSPSQNFTTCYLIIGPSRITASIHNNWDGVHIIDISNPYAPEMSVNHSGKKVKKDRKLKLPAEFVRVYEDYKRTYEIYEITDVLFPYIPRFLERLLADIAQRSRVQKKVTASILRDIYAVRCLKGGRISSWF